MAGTGSCWVSTIDMRWIWVGRACDLRASPNEDGYGCHRNVSPDVEGALQGGHALKTDEKACRVG